MGGVGSVAMESRDGTQFRSQDCPEPETDQGGSGRSPDAAQRPSPGYWLDRGAVCREGWGAQGRAEQGWEQEVRGGLQRKVLRKGEWTEQRGQDRPWRTCWDFWSQTNLGLKLGSCDQVMAQPEDRQGERGGPGAEECAGGVASPRCPLFSSPSSPTSGCAEGRGTSGSL